jgi:hypothetical protein
LEAENWIALLNDPRNVREHPTCLAIALNPSPRRAITRISTACSWVNIGSLKKAAILAQVGQFYFVDGVSITLAVTPSVDT